MNIKVKCDKCSDEFVLSKKNLKNVNVKIKSDDVNIKYFQCHRCKYLFIVQIDNAETDKLLKNAEDLMKKAINFRKRNSKVPLWLNKALSKNAKELQKKRDNLFAKYKGEEITIPDVGTCIIQKEV